MKALIALLGLLLLHSSLFALITEAPPATPDPQKQYLIYLHGGIVTDSNGRPVSEQFGPYEYRAILERFERDGFVVISEIRKDDRDPQVHARRLIAWIGALKKAGVPSRNISVVGASMGGSIATRASAQLDDPMITYVLIANLSVRKSEPVVALHGRVLSIHDESDDHPMIPAEYFARSPQLTESRIIVTKTGLGHGLLYTPHAGWYLPTIEWLSSGKNSNPLQDR